MGDQSARQARKGLKFLLGFFVHLIYLEASNNFLVICIVFPFFNVMEMGFPARIVFR